MTARPPATPGLSTLLREQTRDVHERAERSAVVSALVEGRLSTAAYVDLLVQLRPVYRALEDAAPRLASLPAASGVVDPRLARGAALDADLAALAHHVPETPAPGVAARRYADDVRRASATLGGWCAHAWTRYLGDLSGGQVIRTVLQRRYGLPDDAVGFYAFPGIPRPKPFKDAYRAHLDALPLTEAERHDVVREARSAFDHNTAVLAELGHRHGL